MILSNPLWQLKHSWRVPPSRKEAAKVLAKLRSNLEASHSKELASKVYLVGDELLNNSLEHGCFEIGATRKAELLKNGQFEDYLAKSELNANPDNQWIELELQLDADELQLRVRDSGSGYDLDGASNEKSPDLTRLSQRGLQLVQGLSTQLKVSSNPTQTTASFSLS